VEAPKLIEGQVFHTPVRILEEIPDKTRRRRTRWHLIKCPAASGWFQPSAPYRTIWPHDDRKKAGCPCPRKFLDDAFPGHAEAIAVGKGQYLPLIPLDTHAQRLWIRLGRRGKKSMKTRSTCGEGLSYIGLGDLDLHTGVGSCVCY
jgi:hypothetical protein